MCRELLALDHDVRQVPPVYAKPFRQAHKNNFRDEHAVSEAVQRAIERGWLKLHESGTYVKFTQAGADLFA